MLNLAVIIGRLTTDPELKYTGDNVAVSAFTVAVDRGYIKPGTERQTDFIECVAWRKTAEFLAKYFQKGKMIAVDGHLQTHTYTDTAGNKRKATEIVVLNINFCEGKKSNETTTSSGVTGGDNGDFVEIDEADDLPF